MIDGAGAGEFVLDDVSTVDDLRVNAGDGGATFDASNLDVGDDLVFNGGDGDDVFAIQSSDDIDTVGDDVYLSGRGG